jgi:hypothetical protein
MGPKKDKVKRKNTNIMIDVKKEVIAKHEKNPLPNNKISLPHHLPLTLSTLLHTGMVKLN